MTPRSSWPARSSVDSARPFSTCSISVLVIAPRRYFFWGKVMEKYGESHHQLKQLYKFNIWTNQLLYWIFGHVTPCIYVTYIYIYIERERERFPCPPFKLQSGLFLHVWRGTILLTWYLGRSSRRSRRSWICPDAGGTHTRPVWESTGCRVEDASWWRRHVSWESKGPTPTMLFAQEIGPFGGLDY